MVSISKDKIFKAVIALAFIFGSAIFIIKKWRKSEVDGTVFNLPPVHTDDEKITTIQPSNKLRNDGSGDGNELTKPDQSIVQPIETEVEKALIKDSELQEFELTDADYSKFKTYDSEIKKEVEGLDILDIEQLYLKENLPIKLISRNIWIGLNNALLGELRDLTKYLRNAILGVNPDPKVNTDFETFLNLFKGRYRFLLHLIELIESGTTNSETIIFMTNCREIIFDLINYKAYQRKKFYFK